MRTTYEEERKAQQEQLDLARQEANDRGELRSLYRRRKDLVSCEANSKLILAYFGGQPLTAEQLDDAIDNHPALRARLAFYQSEDYKTTEELRSQLEGLEAKREMRAKPPEELRAMIRPTVSTPAIPSDITREGLLFLANSNVSEFKALVTRYGSKAVDARLNGKG